MIKLSTTLKPLLLLLLLSIVTFTACEDDSDPVDTLSVAETVAINSDLSSISQALVTAGLADTLSGEDPVTLFAVANSAFPDDLSGDSLTNALKYHIVQMNLTFENLKTLESAVTLSGDSLYFSASNDAITINNDQAVITSEGIEAANGVVFVIDTVLTPSADTE